MGSGGFQTPDLMVPLTLQPTPMLSPKQLQTLRGDDMPRYGETLIYDQADWVSRRAAKPRYKLHISMTKN